MYILIFTKLLSKRSGISPWSSRHVCISPYVVMSDGVGVAQPVCL